MKQFREKREGENGYSYNVAEDAQRRAQQESRVFLSALAAYIIVGFLCFGWCYNHPGGKLNDYTWPQHVFGSAIAGGFWPVWLVAHISIQITKWP